MVSLKIVCSTFVNLGERVRKSDKSTCLLFSYSVARDSENPGALVKL